MNLFTQDDLTKILNLNTTAVEQLVTSGKLPYTKIDDKIRFNPDIIGKWILEPDLTMDHDKYVERFRKRYEEKSPDTLKEIKKFGDQFTDPKVPKRFYLEPYPNKKLGIVYYVKYLDNGKLIPSRWCSHTNDREAAERFAIENREKLIAAYYNNKETRKLVSMFSVLEKFYAKDSEYLEINAKRGRVIGEESRACYHNFITKQFIPYLRKERIKDIEQNLYRLMDHAVGTENL